MSFLNLLYIFFLNLFSREGVRQPTDQVNVRETNNSSYELFFWGERFHPVPELYTLPTINVKAMWDLWHFGDRVRVT